MARSDTSFSWTGLGRASARGGVSFDDAGLELRHRLIRDPLRVAAHDVVAVTGILDNEPDVVFGREPRILSVARPGERPNVVVVFARPTHVGPFRLGADRALSLRRGERRHGADVDVILGTVADPAALVAAAGALGFETGPSPFEPLRSLLGIATADEAERERQRGRSSARRRRLVRAIAIPVLVLLQVGRLATPHLWPDIDDPAGPGDVPRITAPLTPNSTVPAPTRLTTVPEAAYAIAASPSSVIDEATAERVYDALAPVRTEAVFYHDEETLRLVEGGAALEWDRSRCIWNHCQTGPLPVTEIRHSFSAPPQATFPAYFIAATQLLGSRGQPVTRVHVFTRPSEREPWLITLVVGSDTENPVLPVDGSGLNAPLPDVPGPPLRSLPELYLDTVSDAADAAVGAGTPPPFDATFDSRQAERIFEAIEHRKADAADGLRRERPHQVEPSEVYVAAGMNGEALTCAALRLRNRVTSLSGEPLVQTDDRPHSWLLPPGRYTSIELEAVEQVCVVSTAGGQAWPITSGVADLRATGDPA